MVRGGGAKESLGRLVEERTRRTLQQRRWHETPPILGAWKDSAALEKYYIIIFCRAVACIDYSSTKIMNMIVVGSD